MHRLVKFIWILLVIWIVSFLIWDEKNIINIDWNKIKISNDFLGKFYLYNNKNQKDTNINENYYPAMFLIKKYPILKTWTEYSLNKNEIPSTIYDIYNFQNKEIANENLEIYKILPVSEKFNNKITHNKKFINNRYEAIKLRQELKQKETIKDNSVYDNSNTGTIQEFSLKNKQENQTVSNTWNINEEIILWDSTNEIANYFNNDLIEGHKQDWTSKGTEKKFYVFKKLNKNQIKSLEKWILKHLYKKLDFLILQSPSRVSFKSVSIYHNKKTNKLRSLNIFTPFRVWFKTAYLYQKNEKGTLPTLNIQTPSRIILKTAVINKKNFQKISIKTWDRVHFKSIKTKEIINKSIKKYSKKNFINWLKKGIKVPDKIQTLSFLDNSRVTFKTPWIIKLISTEKYKKINHKNYLKTWTISAAKEYLKSLDNLLTSDIVSSEDVFYFSSWSLEDWLLKNNMSEIIEGDEIDIKTLESENDEFLQKIFEKNRDPEIMNLIIKNYLDEYQFTKAKKFIESLDELESKNLSPALHLNVIFNSFSLSSQSTILNLTTTIQSYLESKKINKDDASRYLSIISLMQKDYEQFFTLSSDFTTNEHKEFSNRIKELQDQVQKQKWMPSYYYDVLVWVELFNQWFFQPAKLISLSALSQNSNYILPYQVLWYANFLTNSRDTAIEYFKKLVEIDPNWAEKYRFLMWIAYYWDEKFEQSVVMLSLIKDEDLRLDATRYLIRNYIQLNQNNKLILNWSKLLWFTQLTPSDFYTYFYETFYRPYSEWKDFDLYAYDRELAEKMFKVCEMVLDADDQVVCSYWKIWKNIAIWDFNNIEKDLLNLVEQYPQSYLYHALWEYYIKQSDLESAKKYLLKAVSMTQTKLEKIQIKTLLQSIM